MSSPSIRNPSVQNTAIRWTQGDTLPPVDAIGNAAPLLVDATTGKLLVDAQANISTDLSVIEGQLGTIASDLAIGVIAGVPSVKMTDGAGNALTSTLIGGHQALDVNIVGGSGGGGGGSSTGISTIQGFDGTTYRSVKTDTLGNLNVNILSGGGSSSVTLSGVNAGVTLPVSGTLNRAWNLATSTDSLTAAVSSIPAVSLASGQNVGISSLPAVSLANGSTLSSSISNFPSLQAVSGTVTAGRNWNLATSTDSLTAAVSSLPAITGAVTANAGTNLNTSALAVETGGNLASIATNTGHLTDGTQTTKVVNGSNTLAVDSLGAATVNNAAPATYTFSQTGVISTGALSLTGPSGTVNYIDCSQFRTISVQISSSANTWQGVPEVSNDGNNWVQVNYSLANPNSAYTTIIGNGYTTSGIVYVALHGEKYFRIRTLTASTSGTTTLTVIATQNVVPIASQQTVAVSGGSINAARLNSSSATTTSGGSVSTLAGGATVLGGSSATKSLTVQNNNLSGNIYFNVGATNTSTLPQAQCALLTPGQGYTFDVLPSSTQYLFLQSPTSGLTYSLLYA